MLSKLKHRYHLKTEDMDDKRREEVLKYLKNENPQLESLNQEEMQQFIQQYFHNQELQKRKKLQEHLEVFNDAVLAIIITIIVLNLPMPNSRSTASMFHFLETIGIYFVSFVVIANFWLMHHFIFSRIRTGISEKLVVMDFLFMAEISLLPFLTKWMQNDHQSLPVMIYGGVFLLATLTLSITSVMIHRGMKYSYPQLYKQLKVIEKIRWAIIIPLNISFIIAAYWFPRVVFILYVVMPIMSFFSYIFVDDEERKFEKRFQMMQKERNQEQMSGIVAEQMANEVATQVTDSVVDEVATQVTDQVVNQMATHMEKVIEDKVQNIVDLDGKPSKENDTAK